MKKKILISILLYLGAVAHGQVKMGLSGGINLTSVVISNSELGSMGSIPRFGFHAGLGSEVVLKKGFSVIAEAKIITENYGLDVPQVYGDQYKGYDRYSQLSLQLPVRLCYTISNVRLFAGGYFSYLVNSSNKNQIEYAYTKSLKNSGMELFAYDAPKSADTEVFPLKEFCPIDAGPVFGAGYNHGNFAFDLTYSKSLINRLPDGVSQKQGGLLVGSQTLNLGFFFYL